MGLFCDNLWTYFIRYFFSVSSVLAIYLGNGVPEDKVYAHMWANLASSSGFEMAQQLRQLLTEKMTSYQINRAQELARECLKKNYKEC